MRILLLNQAFYPDVVATAQYAAELAEALARAGHEVTVFCSSRAYDHPQTRFPRRESWEGVQIVRLPCSGFGKGARWRRAADFATFLLSCSLRLLVSSRFDLVVALTSPPLISVLGAASVKLKGGKFVFWVMDLNPDEAVAAGWLRQGSISERCLSALLRFSLRTSAQVIALDSFMKQRLEEKGVPAERISVIAPWSHDDVTGLDSAGRAGFRTQHGLADKYVVMYAGNHSPCHPLGTLLQAARELAADTRIVFCFVGGGSGFEKVRRFAAANGLANILQLPYQSREKLAALLSAADLQVVIMGDPFVGIVHPCKVYNLLAVGSPVLYIGPEVSHISTMLQPLQKSNSSRRAPHGATGEVVRYILDGAEGRLRWNAKNELTAPFSHAVLLPRMVAALEAVAQNLPAVPQEIPWQEEACRGDRISGLTVPGTEEPTSTSATSA